jgi:hypothetical protein
LLDIAVYSLLCIILNKEGNVWIEEKLKS